MFCAADGRARTQVDRSVPPAQLPAYNSQPASHYVSTVPQNVAAAQPHHSTASGYRQNPSSLPQTAVANQASANTGLQRNPYIPSVSVFMFLNYQWTAVIFYIIITSCLLKPKFH